MVFTPKAFAVSTSDGAFRLEDSTRGSIVLGAQRAFLHEGEMWKSVVVLWGNMEVSGQVDSMVILSGKVHFNKTAKISKSLVVMGGEFDSDNGAQLSAEQISFRSPGPLWSALKSTVDIWREHYEGITKWIMAVSFCVVMWLFGLLLFLAFPKLQDLLVKKLLSEWAKNLAIGIIGSFFAPSVFIMLVISLIGWPLIPFYLLFLSLMAVVSYIVAAAWLGSRIFPSKSSKKIKASALLLGLVLMQIFWTVQVPFTSLAALFFWTLAWGSLLRAVRSLWK